MEKIEVYGDINEELGVVMAFSKLHESLGFSKLVPSSARGFDIASIEYNGFDVTVEFEYVSSNFILHGYPFNMEQARKYVVVCWEDDCGIATTLKEDYDVELYDIIELRKYISIKQSIADRILSWGECFNRSIKNKRENCSVYTTWYSPRLLLQ